MAMTEAKKRANKKWNDTNMKEKYDRIQLIVPKGKKDTIKAAAQADGESVNAFINRLIDTELDAMGRGYGFSAGNADESV